MLVLLGLLVLAGVSVSAQDEEAPIMKGPEDRPGADVVWQQNVQYLLNATGSTDNEDIVLYSWNITNPDTTNTYVNSTSPTATWTPTQYGIHKIVLSGFDEAGNVGFHLFMMDVVEVLAGGTTITNTDVSYDHSVAVAAGSLTYRNVNIDITGGYAAEEAAGVDAPDQLAESLENSGKWAGHWTPYYGAYGYTHYGTVSEDTSTVLSGSKSIKVSNGNYYYGMEYHFDQPMDLTKYEALSFWLHTSYNNDAFRMYYIYFYGNAGSYGSPYGYQMSGCYQQGGRPAYNGWYPYTVTLDTENTGRYYNYGMPDLSSVSIVRFYFYLYDYYTNYAAWIDNVGFYNPIWGDSITESATPSGDKSGRWATTYGVGTAMGDSFTGSSSVRARVPRSSYTNIYYYFDNAQDLSTYDALRFMLNVKLNTGSQVNYCYYWRSSNLYVYDENGRYAYYSGYSSRYMYYGYGTSYGGKWYGHSLPWGSDSANYDSGVDWTKIKSFRFANIYIQYGYPSGSYFDLYIDALDWYKPGGAGGGGATAPTNKENVPHGIYSLGTGSLEMDRVTFTGDPDFGSFVNSQADLLVKNSTFDGLWGTSHPSIKNSGQTYGGILAFNANANLYDITITGATSSGVYLENCKNVDAHNLDISGHASGYGESAGAIIAYVNTDFGEKGKVKISGSEFYASDGGHGLMIMSFNAMGDADVDIIDVDVHDNGMSGVITELSGYTGNMTVDIIDSEGRSNGVAGFTFYAANAIASANTKVVFTVESCQASENGATGVLFQTKNSELNALGVTRDVTVFDNGNSGITVEYGSGRGLMEVLIEDTISFENQAHGMYIYSKQSNYRDMNGNSVTANGILHIELEGCSFYANDGNGVYEVHNPMGSSNDQPEENFELVARNSTFEKNEGHGWYVSPDGRPMYGNRYAFNEWYNCVFTDNKGNGFYFRTYYYAYYYYGSQMQEHFSFYNCTFTYNERGLRHYTENGAYGCQSWVTIDGCTFEDNDYETIYVNGYWYSYYNSGYTFAKSCEYDIRNTLLDGYVYLDLSGFYDYNAYETWAKASIINCTYTYDEPMFIRLGTYYYNYMSFDATVVYKGNTHTSPSIGDGIYLDLSAGRYLNVFVDIQDMDIYDPLGHGVNVWMHTIYNYAGAKSVSGRVNMVNLDIRNPLEDGIYIHSSHRISSGASASGFYSLLDSRISGVNTGIRTYDFSGEIRNSVFTNVRQETIFTHNGVIDVFNSEVGPIEETNLRVDEDGAIKLWFTLRVKVVWRDEPDVAVKGTTVEIKDNSWTILGVNSIEDMDGVFFSNLNSYTVLPDGIFTKNPYIVTADYIGIIKEKHIRIKENSEVTILMVDDVKPRLTIESPTDGDEQREQSVTIKGTSYDKHTGIDRVMVTIDGENWFPAELSGDKFTFEYIFEDLPEGIILIRARGYDNAGNMKEIHTSILVDSTPPPLVVITPEDGMRTNKRYLEIVGVTAVGSTVYINDQPIEIQYTLISHTLILAEGPNAIKVASVDYLGNIAQVVRYVTLDTQAPYVDIINVEDGDSVNVDEMILLGMTDKEDVTITVNGVEVDIDDGMFEATVTLTEGENTIEIYAVDGVENDRIIMLTVYLDKTAPWLRLTEPTAEILTDNHFKVSGYVEQGSRVFVNDREIDVSFGYFETTVSAPEGAFELAITALDGAGNELALIIPLTVDTIAPAIEVTHPMEGFMTNVDTINMMGTIMGTTGEDMRFLELYINGIPRLFDYTTGEFSHEVLLEEGVNRIVLESMDVAGNSETMVRTVMLDSQAPYLSVFIGNVRQDPNWNEPVSLSDFVYVSGFTEIGVALTIDGVSVDVDGETGYFNYTLTIPKPLPGLSIYTKEIMVTSTDAAGNSVMVVEKANRLKGDSVTVEEETSTAEWLILFLALVIFGMALAGAYGYNRIQSQQEMIEAYETAPAAARVTPDGKVIAPPPARPARGGRPRPKAPVAEDEEEVVIEMDEEEV